MTLRDTQTKTLTTQTKIPSTPTGAETAAPPPPASTGITGLEQIMKLPRPISVNELGRFLRPNRSDASLPRPPAHPPKDEDALPSSNSIPSSDRRDASPPPNANIPGGTSLTAKPGTSRTFIRSPQPGPHVTPLSNIGMLCESGQTYRLIISFAYPLYPANNIDMAIKACAPEKNNLLRNREEMEVVRESLDEGYCDVSGRTADLDFVGTCSASLCDSLILNDAVSIGTMGGVKVYATQGGIPLPKLKQETYYRIP